MIGVMVAALFALYLWRVGAWDAPANPPGYSCQYERNALDELERICYPAGYVCPAEEDQPGWMPQVCGNKLGIMP